MSLKLLLREELKKELPGAGFQNQMMPSHQPFLNLPEDRSIKAAVSVIIYSPAESSGQLLLIKRADYKGHHGGQISFPGGKADKSDSALYNTAIRETYEEIGIKPREPEYLGTLTPLNIQVSSFDVTPFVFYINEKREFKLNDKEVQYIIQCDLSALLDKEIIKTTWFRVRENEILAPYFAIEDEIVWGATAMILAEFKEILRRIEIINPGLLLPGS